MKLLTILFGTFTITVLAYYLIQGEWNWLFAGNIGISVFITFTGLTHFKFQRGMAMMIPDFIPFKMFWVYFTGVIEILLAIGFLVPEYRETSAILLIIFLIIVFIANINSSKKKVNIFKTDYTGKGMNYLYKERLPIQLILIAWTWFFWNIFDLKFNKCPKNFFKTYISIH